MAKTDAGVAKRPAHFISVATHAPFETLWSGLDAQVESGLLTALRQMSEAHRTAMAQAEFAGPPPANEWKKKLIEYRRDVGAEVLVPFIQVAAHKEPATAIGRIFVEAHGGAASACEGLPEEVGIPWDASALAPSNEDGIALKIGKVVARFASAARHEGVVRNVPIRSIARRHLHQNIGPGQAEAALEAVKEWTGWWAQLESVWAEWGRFTLPVLVTVEGEEENDTSGRDAAWSVVAEAARRLDSALEELSVLVPHEQVSINAVNDLLKARGLIDADLLLAGSFLLRLNSFKDANLAQRVGGEAERWRGLHRQSLSRLRLQSAVLAVLSGTSSVRRRLTTRVAEACLGSTVRLASLSEQLSDLAAELRNEPATAGLEAGLTEIRARAEAALAEALEAIPRGDDIGTVVQDGAETTVDAIQAMVRQVPEELVLRASAAAPHRRSLGSEGRSFGLRRMAREAFDALRVERIRSAVLGMLEPIQAAAEISTKLPEVVAFGFDAALKELHADRPGSAERAIELAAEALERTAQAIRDLPAKFSEALDEGAEDVADEIAMGCAGFLDRVESGRVEKQLLAARSRAASLGMRLIAVVEPLAERWSRVLRFSWGRLRRSAIRLLRRGTALVGSEPTLHEQSARTVRALASVEDLTSTLPLVYQRLFSFNALTDSALMVGREAEVGEAMARWSRWQAGHGVPLLVRGRTGTGMTSFMNSLVDKIGEAGGRVVNPTIERRLTSEEQCACLLAAALGLETAGSLDDLARQILQAPQGSLPDVIVLDQLEHVYLRVPGGTVLLERLLTFMAETDPKIFWIGGISTSAWQLVDKVEPTAGAQVDGLDLPLLTMEAFRQAVLLRHTRSGLQVRYEEPREGRHLLKRRLRRLRGTRAHQEILENDFFERLHRASLGDMNLALFLWLGSADFDTTDGEVLMHPLAGQDFSALDTLSLAQSFSLKAFLEHRTLSLEEHDAVFRIPRRESYQILESLGNRNLIERVGEGETGATQSEVVEDLRYQILPLLTGAIISHLQARNIIH